MKRIENSRTMYFTFVNMNKKEALKMVDLATINKMNRESGMKARKSGREPFVLRSDSDRDDLRKIPNFGTYRPKGWHLVRTLFVDSSGFGASDEPAMTFGQFSKEAKVGYGYAIVEAGQFQVYIGEFKRR
jgi:hypothetical protein